MKLSFGDLIIRSHYLWHRGTVNKSNKNRFLIAFLLFEKSRGIKQNQSRNSIKIYNNFFSNSLSGKLKELIYIYLKLIYVLYKLVLSFLKNEKKTFYKSIIFYPLVFWLFWYEGNSNKKK